MTIRIIDNKKINLSDDEWNHYVKIVKSYTTNTNNGADLFQDLFETDENGLIIFLKPPSKKQTSLEVVLFLQNITVQQHIRQMYEQVADICSQITDKISEIDIKLNQLKGKND